jgi:lipopolysaccharide/colanic/teichoic acid biosynthesis glycosyltransferase
VKRAVDLFGAGVGLALAAPLIGIAAVAIKLDDGGPVFYRQRRVGLHGVEFDLVKLRTMIPGAEAQGAGWAVDYADPRITRAGRVLRRLSLDELPQLWNIARGDMSLVGPRPTVASQVERYTPHQRRRLLARPGLTGQAQVSGRNSIPWSERIEIDVRYVDGWTMRRDLAIMLRTALVVLRREGTYKGPRGGFDLPGPGAADG